MIYRSMKSEAVRRRL